MKKTAEEIPDSEVIVKMSSCQKCNGWVTVAVKHMMTTIDANSMAKEAFKYNLKVTEMPLLKWRETEIPYCKCK